MFKFFKFGSRQRKPASSGASVELADPVSPVPTSKVPVEKLDAEDVLFLLSRILEAWPSLIHQFYAALAAKYHLDERAEPFFYYFDVNDEDAFLLAVSAQICFEVDGSEIDGDTKEKFEEAIASSIAHFIDEHLKKLTLNINGVEFDGRSAVIKLFAEGGYAEILEKENQNLFDYIWDRALEMRTKDIELFQTEVSERKLKLVQLLRDAHRRSHNKYGDFEGDAYFNEVDEFVAYVFDKWDFNFFRYPVIFQTVAYEYFDSLIAEQSDVVPEDGHDFEHWVAAKLNDAGWTATVTQASGDDGVDVIAERGDVSVAVQCKRFKGSVGNKAVQEIYSGMKHMQLDRAVVISTGQYTKAAQNLARTTGVLLLSEHDIPHLWELLN